MSVREGSDTLAFQATAEATAPPAAVGATAHIADRAEPARRRIRRGWLVRRMLAGADVLGLSTAFIATEFLFPPNRLTDHLDVSVETLVFLTSLPAWILVAKLYGLYDRDEERARHSTRTRSPRAPPHV